MEARSLVAAAGALGVNALAVGALLATATGTAPIRASAPAVQVRLIEPPPPAARAEPESPPPPVRAAAVPPRERRAEPPTTAARAAASGAPVPGASPSPRPGSESAAQAAPVANAPSHTPSAASAAAPPVAAAAVQPPEPPEPASPSALPAPSAPIAPIAPSVARAAQAPGPGPAGAAGPGPFASAAPSSDAARRTGPRVDASWGGNTAPPYPASSRRMGEQGEVRLDVHVGVDGAVLDVQLRASSGSPTLDRTAIDTVRRWRFRPATIDGQPVSEWYRDWKWIFRIEG